MTDLSGTSTTPKRWGTKKTVAVTSIIVASIIATLIVRMYWQIHVVSGNSMNPTYTAGNLILVDKIDRTPIVGQAVIIKYDGDNILKRIIAVENDTVSIIDCALYINEQQKTVPQPKCDYPDLSPIRVPADHIYILGDNHSDSEDSRLYGPVHTDRIVGIVHKTN